MKYWRRDKYKEHGGIRYNQLFDLQNKLLKEHSGLCGKSCSFILHVFTAVTDIFSTFNLNANFLSATLLLFFFSVASLHTSFWSVAFFFCLNTTMHNSSKWYVFSDNTGFWYPLLIYYISTFGKIT